MRKKAKLLASLAQQNPLLLFVGKAVTASAVTSASYMKHKCEACHTEVAFADVPGMTPYCVACGGNTVPVGQEALPVAPKEELLTQVGCPHCASQNVVEDRMMDVLAGVLHCAACGGGVNFKATAEVTDLETEPVSEMTPGNQPEEGPQGDPQTAAEDGKQGAQSNPPAVVNETLEDPVDQGVDQVAADADAIDVDLSDAADEDGDVEVKLDDDGFGENAKLLAFVDGVHTYTLVKASAGENADLLTHKSYHSALERETAANGHKALLDHGFEPVKVKVQIAKIVQARVEALLGEDRAKVVASLNDVRDNFEQCAKIAAVALNKGFFKGRTNPLKDQLIAQLEGMGFAQAKTVVGRAMANAAPAFVTAMLELADELLDKSVEHRNELSDSLTDMAPEAIQAEVDENVESPEADPELRTSPEEITARLQNPAMPVRRPRQTETASAGGSAASRLRALKNL